MKGHLIVSPGSRSIAGCSLDDPVALVDRRALVEEALWERPVALDSVIGSPLDRSICNPLDRINLVEEACVGEAS